MRLRLGASLTLNLSFIVRHCLIRSSDHRSTRARRRYAEDGRRPIYREESASRAKRFLVSRIALCESRRCFAQHTDRVAASLDPWTTLFRNSDFASTLSCDYYETLPEQPNDGPPRAILPVIGKPTCRAQVKVSREIAPRRRAAGIAPPRFRLRERQIGLGRGTARAGRRCA
jgi:hypothetical protein